MSRHQKLEVHLKCQFLFPWHLLGFSHEIPAESSGHKICSRAVFGRWGATNTSGEVFQGKVEPGQQFFSDACHLHLYPCVCVFCICVCILYLYLRIFQYWEGGISRQSGSWSVAFSSVCNLLRRVNKQMLLPSLAVLAYLQPPVYIFSSKALEFAHSFGK